MLKLVNSYVIDSPQPSNISFLWNFGSLLAFCLVIQIITGVTLAMHYNASVLEAFNSVEHIMRDVNNGWLIRYLHSNTASAFFFIVYLHIGRGLYYGSYKAPRTLVWTIGTVIFILMIATAFLGYIYSPRWFNISVLHIYALSFIYIFYFEKTKGKEKRNICVKENTSKGLKYNKLNKVLCYKNAIGKRRYCTDSSAHINIEYSERLNTIILELGLNPVYVFENLNLEETRKQILNDTKGLSGVYMIINKITKDYYIGSASTNRFHPRLCNHVIYFRGSKIVKSAVKKYKLENFAFMILDLYPNIVTKENNKELLDLEDLYLKLLLPNYNILTEAGSSFGYKHTEVDRQKMKDTYSEFRREMIGSLNRGKNLSKVTIERIREKALSKPAMSDYTKQKCVTHTRPVILYNLDGTVYGKYPTTLEAANSINCNEKTIRRALQTPKNLVKRQWIVKDLSDEQ